MSQNKRQAEMYGENYGAKKGGKGSDGGSSYRGGSQTDRDSNRGIKVYNPPGGISHNVNNSNGQNLKGAKSMPDLSHSRGVKEEGYPPPARYKNTGISYEYPLNAKQKHTIAFGRKVPNKQQKTIREEPDFQTPVKDKRIHGNKGQTPGIVHVDTELSPFENGESPNSTLKSNASKSVGRGRRKSLDNVGSKSTRPGVGVVVGGGPGSGGHKDKLDRKDSAHSTLTGDPYNEDADDDADDNFFDE